MYKGEGKKQNVSIFPQDKTTTLEVNHFYLIHIFNVTTNGVRGNWIMKPDFFINVSEEKLDELGSSSESEEEESKTKRMKRN